MVAPRIGKIIPELMTDPIRDLRGNVVAARLPALVEACAVHAKLNDAFDSRIDQVMEIVVVVVKVIGDSWAENVGYTDDATI